MDEVFEAVVMALVSHLLSRRDQSQRLCECLQTSSLIVNFLVGVCYLCYGFSLKKCANVFCFMI